MFSNVGSIEWHQKTYHEISRNCPFKYFLSPFMSTYVCERRVYSYIMIGYNLLNKVHI
jgi:hypothetical protein